MGNTLEIRWHGRGGQGAKTGAFMLAESMIQQGKFAQGFPDYGPERMGAPIRGYNRISDEPVRVHSGVQAPDIVIVLDPTLIATGSITAGLKPDSVLIVNSHESPEAIKAELGVDGNRVFTVDATGIALEEMGRPIPNTPMIGALLKVTDLAEIDKMSAILTKKFKGKLSDKMVAGNVKALKRAYEEVKEAK
ncbi:MAG: 2-oxoacid:acceptor oxidoreductase family protein [bacterium]|jgi:pyruvate ferredoxin oxidoreductase gamma subunit